MACNIYITSQQQQQIRFTALSPGQPRQADTRTINRFGFPRGPRRYSSPTQPVLIMSLRPIAGIQADNHRNGMQKVKQINR